MDEPGAANAAANVAAMAIRMDICIVMDCTGSMGRWIDAARDTVLQAVEDIRRDQQPSQLRLAFVGYRDIGEPTRFVIHNFTNAIEKVQQLIRDTMAYGGNDAAEDVAGALAHVSELNWDAESKLIVFCADAPAHGHIYHESMLSDRYPRGDPEGHDPKSLVEILAARGIDFTIFRINDSVDKMIKVFAEAHSSGASRANIYQPVFTVLSVENQDGPQPESPIGDLISEAERTFSVGMSQASDTYARVRSTYSKLPQK